MAAPESPGVTPDPLEGLTVDALVGPTASGKSSVALAVCERTGCEIVSLDSMLVYRGLDVGTAKPTGDERARVRHHLLDVAGPEERYDVTRYLADVRRVLVDLAARGRRPLFVGGTAFWLVALLRGLFAGPPADLARRAEVEARVREIGAEAAHAELTRIDPRSAGRIHANDTKRVVRALEVFETTGRVLSEWQREWGWHGASADERPHRLVGLEVGVDELGERIERRARDMLAAGWVDEALSVRAGPGFGPTAIQALGYREVLQLADGQLDEAECLDRIVRATRRFARKQRTWYRKLVVEWLAAPASEHAGRAEARAADREHVVDDVCRRLDAAGSQRDSGPS